MMRKSAPKTPGLQEAADAAAWKLLLRRRPDVAERIRLALAGGRDAEQVLAAAAAGWPRLRLLLPCAIHGCALDLAREREAPQPRRFALRSVRRRTA
jgi:hypothetical protein